MHEGSNACTTTGAEMDTYAFATQQGGVGKTTVTLGGCTRRPAPERQHEQRLPAAAAGPPAGVLWCAPTRRDRRRDVRRVHGGEDARVPRFARRDRGGRGPARRNV